MDTESAADSADFVESRELDWFDDPLTDRRS